MQGRISFCGGFVMSYITGDFPVIADGSNVGKVHIIQNGPMLVFDCTCHYKSQDILRLAALCDGSYIPLGVLAPEAGLLHLKKSYTKNALALLGYDDSRYQEDVSFYLIRSGEVYSANTIIASTAQIDSACETLSDLTTPGIESEQIVYNDFPEPTDYYFETKAEDDVDYSEPINKTLEPVMQLFDAEPTITQAEQNTSYSAETPTASDGWKPIPNPGILFKDFGVQEACVDIPNAHIKEHEDCMLLAVPVTPTEPFPMMPVFCFGSSGKVDEQDCIVFKIRNGNLTL